MQLFKNSFIVFCFLALFCTTGCQNKRSKPNPELVDIDLLRGDIILCGSDEFGEVSFSLSCNYDTQKSFDLAVTFLHSFQYEEAEKAFVRVIDEDPGCAMAYWGVAMSIYHSLWAPPSLEGLEKGSKILKIAESISKSSREKEYLDAIGAYFTDWAKIDHKTRALNMEKKMEEIYNKYEDDVEAAIFYALALNSTADPTDKSYTNQRKAGGILESIFPDQPNHPGIAHYIIHNYDNVELAHLALPTARKYAEIAPASAHAQHMPSHIFTRLGIWRESIESNLDSESSAQCYAETHDLDGHWEQMHAMDYMIYAYLQIADNINANEQYNRLQAMNKTYSADFLTAYPFASIPARIVLENKQWAEAANLKFHSWELQWEQFPWEKSIIHFARALGSSHMGDINSAEKELAILQSLQQELAAKEGEEYKANQVLIQVMASQAWLNFAKGNNEEALILMQEAADMEDKTEKHPVTPGEVLPARELYGDLLLAMNKPSQALEAYEIDLKGHPNRFNGIYGAAIASKGVGDEEKAIMYFEMLMKLVESTESDRPEIEEARAYVEQSAS